jgi:hypothetical protein
MLPLVDEMDRESAVGRQQSSFLRRKNFLNANLINEVLALYVRQMGSLLVIRQVRPDAPGHHHDERAVIHVQPVRTADELVVGVANEGAVKTDGQVGFMESGHRIHLGSRLDVLFSGFGKPSPALKYGHVTKTYRC